MPAYEMRISDWSSDVCSSDLDHQAVVAHARVLHVETPRAAHLKGQQAVVAGAEILDQRLCAERRGRRRRTGLFTVEDQADAEATAAAAALAHQVEVARLEHAQPQRRTGQQDGVQREQGQGFGGHRRQANAARVGAAQKNRSIGGMDIVGAHWGATRRSEAHTSELQSLMRISYAVFCLKKTNHTLNTQKNS